MIDIDTFLTVLYVCVDDFYKAHFPSQRVLRGRPSSLTPSEVITLTLFSQWYFFRSQRDFYRYALRHLKAAFPHLPDLSQYNRLARAHRLEIEAFNLYLEEYLHAQDSLYEVLDTSGVPVRNAKRKGRGWLLGVANVGWCTRIGWFFGFRLLAAVNQEGVITGYGFSEGSAKEQPMSDLFIALRQSPDPHLPTVGKPAKICYLADKGFASRLMHLRWLEEYGVVMICEPQSHAEPWPKPWRKWLHGLRQIVETAFEKLIEFFRLDRVRPHDITGFQTELSAKITLHNFCIWLNKLLGRPCLAFADLLAW